MKNEQLKMRSRLSLVLCVGIFFIFQFSVFNPLHAQWNVEFRGSSANAAGKHIELFAYQDMLSGHEVLLDQCDIDASGAFSLRCFVNYPRLVFLQVENYSQAFYIQAGHNYDVYIPTFDWDIDETRNVFLDPVALPLEFMGVDSGELNMRIMLFDELVDSFVLANQPRMDFKLKPDRKAVLELQQQVTALQAGLTKRWGEDLFFDRYVTFQMAQLCLTMHVDSRKRLFERFISDAPILYHDENYMGFFFSLFEHSVSGGTKKIPLGRMVEWVEKGDRERYFDSLGLDPMLDNEQVRELVMIQALRESYYDARYDRTAVKRMMQRIAQDSKFEEHRQLAKEIALSFKSSVFGDATQDGDSHLNTDHLTLNTVCLPNAEKQTVCLDDFRGKWVYIAFVRVNDPNCLKEIETMAHFRDTLRVKYPDVELVGVSCDREFQKMYHFLNNSRRGARCNWTWLHFNGEYDLLRRYGVVCYPSFVLLDPQGRVYYDYTPAPGSGILLHGPWEKKEVNMNSGGEYKF